MMSPNLLVRGRKLTCSVSGFSIRRVLALVDLSLVDVASQREDKGWTLQSWAEYYNKPADEREKIRNVISLEISETKLAEKIMPPRLVRELDWVEQAWPSTKRKGAGTYPKVQMYCLMSVAECWTVRSIYMSSFARC